ncbi:carbonic anhydrase [Propionivibrio soli]|uniref:carbonic anhydrase n=1 Tax=Propionivibrio soli TaxID=2976531 RepID=UPI0021E88428|nr:carbonic anhydrase family protein [Propionivibrio soli]
MPTKTSLQFLRPLPLLLLLALAPASGQAAQWTGLKTKGSARIEVDSASIRPAGEGTVRAWYRESRAVPKLVESGAFSYSRATILGEFNCDKRTATIVQQIFARADGSEIKSETFDGAESQPVAPDTPLEAVLNQVCKRTAKPVAAASAEPAEPPPPPTPPAVEKKPEAGKKTKGGKEPEAPPPPPAHWSYAGHAGPEKWGSLSADYATCAQGQRQSPIDIRRSVRGDLPPVEFAYKPVPLSIVDNGHSIRVDAPGAGAILLDGESYELQQLHFHRPSEERFNGKAYEMDAHLVHQSKSGKLAVVAVQFEAGKEQELIRTLWTHLPLEQNKPVTRNDVRIDPSRLLPKKRNYVTYLGSLTTPPCTEGVTWVVLKTPVQASREQLNDFATIYKNNARPVQPINNRVIKESR